MFYYIDQSCTPSFPIGLVKTESEFIVRSVETDLGRWTLATAVINVNAYPIWLSQAWPVTFRIQEYVCCLISRRPNLEVATETSTSAGKTIGVLLVSYCTDSVFLQLYLVVWIFLRTLSVICYNRWVLIGSHKNYFSLP